MKAVYIILASLVAIFAAQQARAVPPPDFVFSAGSAIAQVFSLAFLFLSAVAGSTYRFVKVRLTTRRAKISFLAVSLVLIVALATGGACIFDSFYQKYQYQQWLTKSQARAEQPKAPTATSGSVVLSSSTTTEESGDISQAVTSTTQISSLQAIEPDAFFKDHEFMKPTTTEQAFQAVVSSTRQDYMVLDAREDLEYELGNFPNSSHIRFADLKDGRWAELPRDKYVYVFCWSGIRGLETANFLRSHKILAISLEGGASGWVATHGLWQGGIMFTDAYPDARYKKLFTTQQIKDEMKAGVILVDSREPEKYQAWHIPGSVNIPLLQTPTSQLEEAMDQVPAGAKVITVCDAYVNCFDAKLTAVELEKRGHEFLGRYNQPWDLQKTKN